MLNEKFVAYIDILGFKAMVSKRNAGGKLRSFYQSIYDIWAEMRLASESGNEINGLVFSDSLTIHTRDASQTSLDKILSFIQKLYKISLFEHGIMIRGGLAKGEFNAEGTIGFSNLDKNLFFGQAFIDAYEIENKNGIKGCRFVFNKSLLDEYRIQKVSPAKSKSGLFDFHWIDKKGLTEKNNEKLNIFYELALENNWSDHYVSTLDLFCLIADIDKYDIIKQKISESSRANQII